MSACICEWPDGCGGIGTLYCDGCGGDQCVCFCGGEFPCDGCDECAGAERDLDDEIEMDDAFAFDDSEDS